MQETAFQAEPYYEDPAVTLLAGDAAGVLPGLAAGSVQTVVTSPPYFGLRDYGAEGQLGAEASLDDYVAALLTVFRGVWRILADDGTLWLNLGDSYNADGRKGRSCMGVGKNAAYSAWRNKTAPGTKPKDLLGVPWLVAFALRADGWYLRSDIVWSKPNAMPESVTDRPTRSHEYVFLLTKRERYYYDAAAIREPVSPDSDFGRARPGRPMPSSFGHHRSRLGNGSVGDADGRNKRSVWTLPTALYAGAHFATFPPALVEPCVRAGSRPGDTVLDPFCGSGTAGAVARQLGRRFVGIDINREYLDLAKTRLGRTQLALMP